jgi:hypothetical protein
MSPQGTNLIAGGKATGCIFDPFRVDDISLFRARGRMLRTLTPALSQREREKISRLRREEHAHQRPDTEQIVAKAQIAVVSLAHGNDLRKPGI